jgi:Zn-dependent M28 family amino/carboxypeptidase
MALILAWGGAVPLMLSIVGAANHGTLDNASGVAALLDAAALVPASCAVGIVITDAEELALAGAEAWATRTTPAVALNCDSVDDEGDLVIMYTGRAPSAVVSALRSAASRRREPIRVMRLIPGILTDSVALARAGWRTVTLSRGTARTLRRIHTSRDTLAHMDGRGIEGAAHVLAQAAMELAACR